MDIKVWKILMVDDDEDDFILTRQMLSTAKHGKYVLEWARSYEDGWGKIQNGSYDVVLVDYDLGLHNGLELSHKVVSGEYEFPIILLTGRGSYEVDLEAMRAGVSFYLTKSEINTLLLERGIRYAIERKQNEKALAEANEELARTNALLSGQKQELEISQAQAIQAKNRLEAVMQVLPVGVAITDEQGGSIEANPAYEQVWGGSVRPAERVEDYVVYRAWWADTRQPVASEEWASAQAVLKGESVFGQVLEIQRFDGKRGYVLNSASPVRDESGKIVGSAVVIQDISHLKESEILNQALNLIHQVLLTTLDFEAVMQNALSVASQALGSDTSAISFVEDRHWHVRYVHGFPREIIGKEMNDDEERHAVLAIQTQKPVAIRDALNDERVNREHMRQWGIRSVLVVPILLRGEALGVIFFNYQSSPFEFQEHHIQFGINLAVSISLALENTRLFGSLKQEIQEHERAEQALRDSENQQRELAQSIEADRAKLAAVLENLPVGVWITDETGRITQTNQKMDRDLTGDVGLAEQIDQHQRYSTWDPVTGNASVPEDLPMPAALRTGQPVGPVELNFRSFDGIEGTVLVSAAPIRDKAGNLMGVVETNLDITQRKKAEIMRERLLEENNQQRAFLERLIQAVPVAIAVLKGPEHRYTITNPHQEFLSRGKGNLIGRTVAEVWSEGPEQILPILDRVYQTGETFSANDVVFHIIRDQGPEDAFFNVSYTPLRDPQGNVEGILALAVETTEQVSRQKALEQ